MTNKEKEELKEYLKNNKDAEVWRREPYVDGSRPIILPENLDLDNKEYEIRHYNTHRRLIDIQKEEEDKDKREVEHKAELEKKSWNDLTLAEKSIVNNYRLVCEIKAKAYKENN